MRYRKTGFHLDGPIDANGLLYKKAAAVAIKKGDALHDDGSGYATNAITAFAATFLGVAAEDCANSAGAAGDLSVAIIPPLPHYRFWVCNSVTGTQLAQTDVNETVDLEECNTIDCTDNTVVGWGFQIDEIDISAEALAADGEAAADGGFAKGRFVVEGDAA